MTNGEFGEYLYQVSSVKTDNPTWRMGQTYFNVLYHLHPLVANMYRSSYIDPFYKDDNIPKFLEHVYNNHVTNEVS